MNRSIKKLLIVMLMLVSVFSHTILAEGERATFDTGMNVADKWEALAGGRNNVTAIRQYSGSSLPEEAATVIVSSSASELPIYSWYEDGTVYYWSEDPKPYTNADASYMFEDFQKVRYIDAAPLDTSKTTDMEAMFANCKSLETLDVSGFDTSNVRCMYCMFIYCSSLTELDVSHFNTSRSTSTSDVGYGSLCGMFLGCSSIKVLNLSSFDMTGTSWPYHTQNMFPGCTSLEKLILGPNVRFNSYTALSGSWTHEDSGLTLSGSALCYGYNASNAFAYSGTWIRNLPEGHYYRTDGSLGDDNLWEVHTPDDRFKGYCLNLNRFGVGEELDRILVETDADIEALLCTAEQGSVHGFAPLGDSMKEALITLIYYGWPNDAAGIQQRYGLSDQEYMDITQNAIWDFTDRYDEPAGPSHYEGNQLAAYQELVAQRYANIEGNYILFLYKSWDPSKQNLLSIEGVDDQEYGGVSVRKQNADGSENLAGAEFTVYDSQGNEVGTMVTSENGTAYICRTDHSKGLPLGEYTVKETKAPSGYFLSDIVYHFTISEANEIVTIGWRVDPANPDSTIEEEMIYYDAHDDDYVGGGIGIIKKSDTGKMLVGAEFTIYDSEGNEVATLVTNNSGIAATGKQDLPLGTYTIKETKAPGGYAILTEEITVEVTENMKLLTYTFVNEEKKGSIVLQAAKLLESDTAVLEAGQYTFELLDDHYNVIQTATNDEEGNVVFNTIEYTADDLGYKNYHIVEVIGDDSGIRYDRHQEDVTVTIYDDGGAVLNYAAVYDSDGAVFTNSTNVVYHEIAFRKNKLNTQEAVEGAVMEIRDTSNRLIDSWVSNGDEHKLTMEPGIYVLREIKAPEGYFEFKDIRFELLEDGTVNILSEDAEIEEGTVIAYDRPIPSTELELHKKDSESAAVLEGAEFTLTSEDGSYSSVITTDKNGKALFTGLETGTYVLSETKAPKGYRSGEGPWTVEVEYNRAISKSGNISTYGIAAGDYSNEGIDETVTIPGSESIHIELKYQTEDGYDYLLLLDKNGNVIKQDKDGNPIGDTRAAYRGYLWGGMEDGVIHTLSFDLDTDTVRFRFVPDANTAAYGYYAVVTSPSRIRITDPEGNQIDPEEGIYSFTNKKVDPVTVQFEGTKTLTGKDLMADEFSFTLTGSDGTEETVTNDADGKIVFPEISYTEEGDYIYTIKENTGNEEGIAYDNTVYSVFVTVSRDDNGILHAEVSGADNKALDFSNTYEEAVSEVTVRFEGNKKLYGKELEEGEFSFTLSGSDGTEETVSNDADGKIAFSEISYTEEGTYTYEIKENITEEEGIFFDENVYEVTVTVTKDENGKLTAEISGDDPMALDFNNGTSMILAGGVLHLEGNKTLTGKDLSEGEFSFTLTGSDGTEETVSNDADGKIVFSDITFTEAGTYVYEIRENASDEDNVMYDGRVYTFTVEVIEEEEGVLIAMMSGPDPEAVNFHNVYQAADTSVSVQFSGSKTLTGKDLEEGEFSFTLTGSDGTEETVTNDADGKIVFSEIIYNETGDYHYTVKENAGEEDDVLFDETVYEIDVAVSRNEDGKLVAEISGSEIDALDFHNTYQEDVKEVTVQFTANKALTGKDLSEGEFSFTLIGSDGTKETVTNDANGKIVFPEITYDSEGTYTYEIKENKGNETGIAYDDTIYKISVIVVENDGALTAEIRGGDAMEFINSYTRSYGDLTIRKTVIGDGSDSSQEFTFVVELDAEGEFKYDGDRSGTVRNGGTIVLKGGESVTIHHIPAGCQYNVYEVRDPRYVATSSNASGVISGNGTEASFTNRRVSIPQTGVDAVRTQRRTPLWLIGMIAAAAVLKKRFR